MEFLTAYGLHVGSIAGIVGGFALFLGYVDELTSFFRNNREMMVAVLIVHSAFYSLYWAFSGPMREAKRLAGLMKEK